MVPSKASVERKARKRRRRSERQKEKKQNQVAKSLRLPSFFAANEATSTLLLPPILLLPLLLPLPLFLT